MIKSCSTINAVIVLQKKENQPMYNVTIGMDLGDKKHQIHILDADGKTIKVCQISNTAKALTKFFTALDRHPWVTVPVNIDGFESSPISARPLIITG